MRGMRKKLLTFTALILISAAGAFAQTGGTKIDEFGSIQCEDYLARMDSVTVQASNNPGAKMYVVVYEGKTKRYKYSKSGSSTIVTLHPQYGLANATIRSMKKYLALKRVEPSAFVFVKGGFREDFTVEIFLVSNGEPAPEANPTVSKMKYRKGKPTGFCTGCCEP